MDAEVHDPPGEPADGAGRKKGVRALFSKVNRTKALNSWLEDTALGELIGVGQGADSAASPAASRPAAAPRSSGPQGSARPAAGIQASARQGASRPSTGRKTTAAGSSAGTPGPGASDATGSRSAARPPAEAETGTAARHTGDLPATPPGRRARPATSRAARKPRAAASPEPSPATAESTPAPPPDATPGTEPGAWPSLRKRSSVPADPGAASEPDVTSTQPIPVAGPETAAGTEPSGPHHPRAGQTRTAGQPLTDASMAGTPVMSWRPRINPRLRADPRARVWLTRIIIMLILFAGFSTWTDWRYGVTAAIIYATADLIYRSKTTAPVPAAVRVTSAQRYTRRRLRVLKSAGYLALHARTIPGTNHVIDHVVVGPAGVFTLDSQRLDRRLPLRALGGMLYHGRTSMEGRLDHAKDESRLAAGLIAEQFGRRVRVKPVMVMYGPSVSWVIMSVKGVDVFDGSRIGTYFRRQTKLTGQYRLTSKQITMVFEAAARALPPLA